MTFTFWPIGRVSGAPAQALLGTLAIATALIAAPLRADEIQDASQLLRQGQHAQALDRINQYLSSRPRDAQGRFLKGLILAEQSKSAEAIDVFTKLTQDYPELPEPYNNLAVLYAAQGQYEKARQSLEMSIRTHPSYATAYENLGDVYTKLASQSYDKALQLDSSNSVAKTKLLLMRDLIAGSTTRTRPAKPAAAKPEAARADARAEPPKPVVVAAAPRIDPPKPAAVAAVAPRPVEPGKAAPTETRAPADTRPAAGAAGNSNDEVLKTVQAWAQAWASKDVKAYLSFYARDFKTPAGESRGDWEKERALRITGKKRIEVGVSSPRVAPSGDNLVSVTFRQAYRSDGLNVTSTKTLVFVRANGKWLIQQERTGS